MFLQCVSVMRQNERRRPRQRFDHESILVRFLGDVVAARINPRQNGEHLSGLTDHERRSDLWHFAGKLNKAVVVSKHFNTNPSAIKSRIDFGAECQRRTKTHRQDNRNHFRLN